MYHMAKSALEGAVQSQLPPPVIKEEFAPAIAVEDLCKNYSGHWAVDEVNFVVPRGWTIGLLGGNGAGKTTTIAMIMGLVVPSYGRAVVLGHDMARDRRKVLKRMNFESPYVALPARLTVRQNLTGSTACPTWPRASKNWRMISLSVKFSITLPARYQPDRKHAFR
jgi:ABC-type multidrug transport system ATPase subunit